jgi:transcription initiation factor TFIIB
MTTTNQHVFSLEKKSKCPICRKVSILEDSESGEIICCNCGSVLQDSVLDTNPEYRTFSFEDLQAKQRVGRPSSLAIHDRGLGTTISQYTIGRVSSKEKSRIERMKVWDRRTQLQTNAGNLKKAFTELKRLEENLNLSKSIIEKAAYIYRKALKKDLLRGRSISSMIAASLYYACRLTETPRYLKDLAKVSKSSQMDIAKSYRLLFKELNLDVPVADPIRSISKIASKVGVSEKIARRSMDILLKAKEAGVSEGKSPQALAATALYIACSLEGISETQKKIAVTAGVTEVTIRNRSKGLWELATQN